MTVIWLPFAVVLGSLGFFINFYDLNARFKAAKIYGERGLEAWRRPDRAMSYLVRFLIIIILIGLPFITWETVSMLQIPIFLGVVSLIGKQITTGRLPITHRPAEGMMLYFFIGWLLVTALFGGISEGIKDTKRNEPVHFVSFKSKNLDILIL